MRFSVLPISVVVCCAVVASRSVLWAITNDADQCLNGSADERIAACTGAIDSGRLQGNELAAAYGRGNADIAKAKELDPNVDTLFTNVDTLFTRPARKNNEDMTRMPVRRQ